MDEIEQHDKDYKRSSSLPTNTKIWYIIIVSMWTIIFWIALKRTWKKIKEELIENVLDYFKLTQLIFIILYLLTRIPFMFITIIPNFEFFYGPGLSFSVFFFYYFEHINNLWWVSFIMHMVACKPDEMTLKIAHKIRFKETLMTITFGIIFLLSGFFLIIIIIFALVHKWSTWHSYFQKDDIIECDYNTSKCALIFNLSSNFMTLMFSFGCLAAGLKVIIGIIVLKVMKSKMKVSYNLVKRRVILTLIVTPFTMIINTLINYTTETKFANFYVFVSTKVIASDSTIIYQCSLEFIMYVLEVFLMSFTADNISYREYIMILLYGRKRMDLLNSVSLFLRVVPQNNLEASYRTGSVLSIRRSSTYDYNEDMQKFLDGYESHAHDNGYISDNSGIESGSDGKYFSINRHNTAETWANNSSDTISSLLPPPKKKYTQF